MLLLCSVFYQIPPTSLPLENQKKRKIVTKSLDSMQQSYCVGQVLFHVSNRTHWFTGPFRNGSGKCACLCYVPTLRHKRSPSKAGFRSKGLVIYLSQRMKGLSKQLVWFHVFTHKKTKTQEGEVICPSTESQLGTAVRGSSQGSRLSGHCFFTKTHDCYTSECLSTYKE